MNTNIETGMIMDGVTNIQFEDNQNAMEAMQSAIDSSPSKMQQLMMRYQRPKQQVREYPKIRRNDLCPCGSGKKYKNCCLESRKYEGLTDARK